MMMKHHGSVDTHPKKVRDRFGEPQKFLPVAFVSFTTLFLIGSYIFYHIYFMLQLHVLESKRDPATFYRGIWEALIFIVLTTLQLICYVRSIQEDPGTIPDKDPQWMYETDSKPDYLGRDEKLGVVWVQPQEMKKSGARRHCKWCGRYKPDRCHHCRVCKSCILKMDHHCPWLYNCVGFGNYKFFFLLLLYSALDSLFIVTTMSESVQRVILDPVGTTFLTMFFTFFTETLAFFMAALVTIFFFFHIMLMSKGMTTIEYCEKSQPKKEGESKNSESSVYDLGLCGNIRSVLGDNWLFWLLPCARPPGDGLNFVSDETRLSKDLEAGKGIRRISHQKTQRPQRAMYGGTSYYGYGSS